MIKASWDDAATNPIMTTIDTISTAEIPFPQITVNLGPVSNPWGYIEKAYNHLKFVGSSDVYARKPPDPLR